MGGAHRRGRQPRGRRWRPIRWPAVARAAALPALLGLAIYLLISGTNLEGAASLLAVWIASFAWALVRHREDLSYLCLTAGAVILAALELVSLVAHRDGWPASDLWVIGMTGDCLRVAAGVSIGFALMADIRAGRLSWPPWRPAGQDGAGQGGAGQE